MTITHILITGASVLLLSAPALAQSSMPQPATGTARQMAGPVGTEADARARIESNGYSGVQKVARSGDGWTASAMKDGKRKNVRIGADGMVNKGNVPK